MTMTDYMQLIVFVLHWLQMKLYGFTYFVEQQLVPYEYASTSLVVIEASMWLLQKGIFSMMVIDKSRYIYLHCIHLQFLL